MHWWMDDTFCMQMWVGEGGWKSFISGLKNILTFGTPLSLSFLQFYRDHSYFLSSSTMIEFCLKCLIIPGVQLRRHSSSCVSRFCRWAQVRWWPLCAASKESCAPPDSRKVHFNRAMNEKEVGIAEDAHHNAGEEIEHVRDIVTVRIKILCSHPCGKKYNNNNDENEEEK